MCDKVVCVCDKVVCDRGCECVGQSCIRRWSVAKLCVKGCVRQSCVRRWSVTKLRGESWCVPKLCVAKLCDREAAEEAEAEAAEAEAAGCTIKDLHTKLCRKTCSKPPTRLGRKGM